MPPNYDTTSDDAIENEMDCTRVRTLLRLCLSRLDKLEIANTANKQRLNAVEQLAALLANNTCAMNAWEDFVMIVTLIDPDAKQYINKIR
jgi:hypothetical protein